jgi:hypothetical protein
MRAGMPIYAGARDRSIEAAHQALLLVNSEIEALTPPVTTKAAEVKPAESKTVEKSKEKKAAQEKPGVKEKPAAVTAETKETPEQKVAASQANMRKGYEALQKALKDLKAATSLDAAKSTKLDGLLQAASTEAMKGITQHASEG